MPTNGSSVTTAMAGTTASVSGLVTATLRMLTFLLYVSIVEESFVDFDLRMRA